MTDVLDQPTDVREGEELDADALTRYLADHIEDLEPPVAVRQFPSGYSNLTYSLETSDGREFVLRRPPFGANVASGHDMSREWRVLSALANTSFDKAPTPYVHCEDEAVIGAPFYVMERVRGVILRGADPGIPGLDDEAMRAACHELVDTLTEIHAVDLDAAELTDFGRPEGYVQRQVEGWTRRWRKAQTDEVATIDRVSAWLSENMPDDLDGVLIHNDFKYDNVVYDEDDFGRIEAVLDWEMATVGDPLMDLGTSLAYWVEPEDDTALQHVVGPTAHPGNLTRAQVARRYAERTGRDLSNIVFYYVFGLFKVAVIGQQIYARYVQGHTRDERFAGLIHLVRALGERAQATLDRDEI